MFTFEVIKCSIFQDVIWNENIKLDDMFKFSLAIDIFKVSLQGGRKGVYRGVGSGEWDDRQGVEVGEGSETGSPKEEGQTSRINI